MDHVALPIEAWANFYVIVGSAAGGLTGLTFVVITLVSGANAVRLTGLRAFVTPSIMHFSLTLLLSALLNIPGQNGVRAGVCLGALGLWGVLYTGVTAQHLWRLRSGYTAVAEDWIWNVLLPLLAYAGLLAAGLLVRNHVAPALELSAAVALSLLFIGIHNAWDIAVWFTAERPGAQQNARPPVPHEPPSS
jgi:hypothetical protein